MAFYLVLCNINACIGNDNADWRFTIRKAFIPVYLLLLKNDIFNNKNHYCK